MTKKKSVTIKPETPFWELLCLVVTLPLAVIVSLAIIADPNFYLIRLLLATTLWGGIAHLLLMVYKRYKAIEIAEDFLTVKSLLGVTMRRLNKSEIKGYDFKEVYMGPGTIWITRIVVSDADIIELRRDGYRTYEHVIEKIKDSGLIFLGRSEIGAQKKRLYGWMMTWGIYLIILTIILILHLMKVE